MKISKCHPTKKSRSETKERPSWNPWVFYVSYSDGMLALWADIPPGVEWRPPDGWSRRYGRSEHYARILAQFIAGNSDNFEIRWADEKFAMRWAEELPTHRKSQVSKAQASNCQLSLFGGE
jgi:hypothetical protein